MILLIWINAIVNIAIIGYLIHLRYGYKITISIDRTFFYHRAYAVTFWWWHSHCCAKAFLTMPIRNAEKASAWDSEQFKLHKQIG